MHSGMKPKTILIAFLAAALPASLSGQACPTANPVVVTTAGNTGQSLRWAIGCVNSVTPLTTIQFNIPGAGPHIIQPNATAAFIRKQRKEIPFPVARSRLFWMDP